MEYDDFSIQSFSGGYDQNFTYLITCKRSRLQLLVDAAIPYRTIESFVDNTLAAVLITHTHSDHIMQLKSIIAAYPAVRVVLAANSSFRVPVKNFQGVHDSNQITFGGLKIDIIQTPGHYPDSMCYKIGKALFTGDTLFIGRTGRTIGAGSDVRQLYRSVYYRLLNLPGETQIYPGHNYGPRPSISLAENIKISPLLQAKNEEDFVLRMKEYEANRYN